ncbi:MAG: Sec-independent protein translocase subunit TatB [Campylobacterales bacterium]|nr:Sec-independent protein translocase subunit TatB [Campylobacterales bacterium]
MFGLGFTEIILILIVAILFLGPDKLPTAMVEIAKFIKSFKKGVHDAKSVIDEELKIADLKEEMISSQKALESATDDLKGFKNIDLGLNDVLEDKPKATQVEPKRENITFEKKSHTIQEPTKTQTQQESK